MSVTAPQILLKQPSEKLYFSMDFSNLVADGETISSPTVTSEKSDGSVSDLDITGVTINGLTVEMWIADGTTNTKYRVEVVVNSSGGSIIEGDGILVVKDK